MTGPDARSPCGPSIRSRPASEPAGRRGASETMPDPWGVRRAENLLTTLEGILSARVVTTPLGEVSEIHILAQAGLQPKQLVRNIESALLAQLGLKVDHRKISIAQTAEVKPIEALDRHGGARAVLQRTVLFENLAVAPGRRPQRIMVAVTLSYRRADRDGGGGGGGHAAEPGRGGGAGGGGGAGPAAGRSISMALEGAQMIEAFDREVVFVAVQGLGGRDTVLLTGHGGDQGERGAGGGVRGAGRDESVDGGAAAGLNGRTVGRADSVRWKWQWSTSATLHERKTGRGPRSSQQGERSRADNY